MEVREKDQTEREIRETKIRLRKIKDIDNTEIREIAIRKRSNRKIRKR